MEPLKVRILAHREHLVIVPHEPDKGIGPVWTPAGSYGPKRLYMMVASVVGDTETMLGVSEEALALLQTIKQVTVARPMVGDVSWVRCEDGGCTFAWRGPIYALIHAPSAEANWGELDVRRDKCTLVPNVVPTKALAAIQAGRRRAWKDPSEVAYTADDLRALGHEVPLDANAADESPVFPKTPFAIEPSLILLGRRGSEAHGTYVPPEDKDSIDDRDLLGLCIPPESMVLGTGGWEGHSRWESSEEINGVWDVVLYDLRKFVRLLCKQNPNALSMLWLEPDDYLRMTDVGRRLVDARELFRSRDAAYESFVGYTKAQMEKMTTGAFKGYMGAKRKQLVERYGFDCKNASHAVRLLHMGCEYLLEGQLHVRRYWDRQMLIEIKSGKWTLEQVKEHVAERLDLMRTARHDSKLPEAINFEQVEELTVSLMHWHLGRARREQQLRHARVMRDLADELSLSDNSWKPSAT